jgi:hypothetical protein
MCWHWLESAAAEMRRGIAHSAAIASIWMRSVTSILKP